MSARQRKEWEIYYSIEPFGEQPAYLRAGIVAATIANMLRGKSGKAFSPADFMPKEMEPEKAPPKVQSLEEQKAMLKGIYNWAKKHKLTKEDEAQKPPVKRYKKPKGKN